MFGVVGHCPKCGAPIYAEGVWMGTTPPPSRYSCMCNQMEIHKPISVDGPLDEPKKKLLTLVQMQERIAKLEAEQARLVSALKLAEDALEFYANPDNYDFHKSWGKVCIMAKDCETGVRDPFMKIKCGGKRARQALQEIRKVGV
jgi:hypothetical protein